MGADVEFLEFDPDAAGAVLAAMAGLADGGGWLTLDPAIDERFPAPEQSTFGRLVSGRGPAVPRATWVPADTTRRRPEPVSVGILHATGAGATARLEEKGCPVPERWRVVSDHSKRGLVAWVPIDVPHADVLTWTLAASRALTRIPLTGRWRAAVHRR
ncbi:MAG TPA: hypothetical protein VFV42_11895 [Acidimicrobiales bacterium]|nr:hypothetical protein [Acidimicrobiales bacterium]